MKITAKFQTILTNGFTIQNGTDNRACGAATHVEIRKGKNGYLLRKTDSNGRYQSSGRACAASGIKIAELLAIAEKRK